MYMYATAQRPQYIRALPVRQTLATTRRVYTAASVLSKLCIEDLSRYTIFCAASPHETAKEISQREGTRGALSFCLLEILSLLKSAKVPVSNQAFYRTLLARFQALPHRQTPRCMGIPISLSLGVQLSQPTLSWWPSSSRV